MNNINKAVLLSGGSGSRLSPLTDTVNKHMLPVYDRPMLQWNVEKMVKAGIKKILIISGTHHMGSIIQYFGSGSKFGCELTYKVQDEAGGIAEALKLTKDFVDGEKFITILGDNIFEDDLYEFIFQCEKSDSFVAFTSYEVDDPERFGVFQNGLIVEKPKDPETNKIVAGIYMYLANEDFWKDLNSLEYSSRGELEITDLNNKLIEAECVLTLTYPLVYPLKGEWTDAGTIESLYKASELMKKKQKK